MVKINNADTEMEEDSDASCCLLVSQSTLENDTPHCEKVRWLQIILLVRTETVSRNVCLEKINDCLMAVHFLLLIPASILGNLKEAIC